MYFSTVIPRGRATGTGRQEVTGEKSVNQIYEGGGGEEGFSKPLVFAGALQGEGEGSFSSYAVIEQQTARSTSRSK